MHRLSTAVLRRSIKSASCSLFAQDAAPDRDTCSHGRRIKASREVGRHTGSRQSVRPNDTHVGVEPANVALQYSTVRIRLQYEVDNRSMATWAPGLKFRSEGVIVCIAPLPHGRDKNALQYILLHCITSFVEAVRVELQLPAGPSVATAETQTQA